MTLYSQSSSFFFEKEKEKKGREKDALMLEEK